MQDIKFLGAASPRLAERYRDWFSEADREGFNPRRLDKLVIGLNQSRKPVLKDGTKLLRIYQGEAHQVLVQGGTFLYNNKRYKSLTAIAKEITGKKWNGNLFFMHRVHK